MARLTVKEITARVEELGLTLSVLNSKTADKYQVVSGFNPVFSANTLKELLPLIEKYEDEFTGALCQLTCEVMLPQELDTQWFEDNYSCSIGFTPIEEGELIYTGDIEEYKEEYENELTGAVCELTCAVRLPEVDYKQKLVELRKETKRLKRQGLEYLRATINNISKISHSFREMVKRMINIGKSFKRPKAVGFGK